MITGGEGCALYLGSCIRGIPVRLHYTYFILLIVQLIMAISRYGEPSYTWLMFCLYGPILLITVVIHEYGHAITTQRLGGECDGIVLWPLGGFALCGLTEGAVLDDFKIAFMGPITHAPQILFWVLVTLLGKPLNEFNGGIDIDKLSGGAMMYWISTLAEQTVILNFVLLVFNLLVPAYPLDGGRCLAAMLVHCGTPVPRAAYITAWTAIILSLGIIGYGAWQISTGVFAGVLMILVGVFIIFTSIILLIMTKSGHVHMHPLFSRPCYKQAKGGCDHPDFEPSGNKSPLGNLLNNTFSPDKINEAKSEAQREDERWAEAERKARERKEERARKREARKRYEEKKRRKEERARRRAQEEQQREYDSGSESSRDSIV